MKKLLVILLLFFVLGCEQKRPLPQCEGIDDSQWTNCFGAVTNADGDEYVGEWKDGKKHGQGTYTDVNGDKYVGEFKDGKIHGQGTITYAPRDIGHGDILPGNIYVGELKDGKYHGQGTLTYADKSTYVGEFKDGKRHGKGTKTYYGEKTVGEWKDGYKVYPKVKIPKEDDLTKSSLPKCKGSDHSKWTNCFGTSKKDGSYSLAGNVVKNILYIGEWKDGKKDGQGKQTYSNGDIYVGEWKNNKQNGEGTLYFAYGDKLVCGEDAQWHKDTDDCIKFKEGAPRFRLAEEAKDYVVSQEAIAFGKKIQEIIKQKDVNALHDLYSTKNFFCAPTKEYLNTKNFSEVFSNEWINDITRYNTHGVARVKDGAYSIGDLTKGNGIYFVDHATDHRPVLEDSEWRILSVLGYTGDTTQDRCQRDPQQNIADD